MKHLNQNKMVYNITPKEKAIELFNKFRTIPPSSPYTGIDDPEAKQCTLIAIDEILNNVLIGIDLSPTWGNYWNKVKEELIKL
jgi:hypothetical protein